VGMNVYILECKMKSDIWNLYRWKKELEDWKEVSRMDKIDKSWLNNTSRAGTVRIYACGQCSGGGTCTECTGSTSHHWLKQEAMTSISHGSS
jgi:hypothetical protein